MRQITVLEVNPSDGGYITVNCVFWFTVPAGSQVPIPNFSSSINSQMAGALAVSASELALLQSGASLEEYSTFKFPTTYSAATIKSELVSAWTTRNAYRQTLPAKIAFYGLTQDSVSGWSA